MTRELFVTVVEEALDSLPIGIRNAAVFVEERNGCSGGSSTAAWLVPSPVYRFRTNPTWRASLRAHSKNVALFKVRFDFMFLDGNPQVGGLFPDSKSLITISMWIESQALVFAVSNFIVEHWCRTCGETASGRDLRQHPSYHGVGDSNATAIGRRCATRN